MCLFIHSCFSHGTVRTAEYVLYVCDKHRSVIEIRKRQSAPSSEVFMHEWSLAKVKASQKQVIYMHNVKYIEILRKSKVFYTFMHLPSQHWTFLCTTTIESPLGDTKHEHPRSPHKSHKCFQTMLIKQCLHSAIYFFMRPLHVWVQ